MKDVESKKAPTGKQREALIRTWERRFADNRTRHPGLTWTKVQERLDADAGKLWSLAEMERTGGEPDVVGQDNETGEYLFMDCSTESPAGRTSVCYDRAALDSRKEFKPKDSAVDLAAAMGVEILTEEQYRALQSLGEFDAKSSSWLKTPAAIRKLGGGLFGDRRFGQVWVYHNGAQSYYASRGFRALLRV